MNIVITGATGFLGRRLVRRLLEDGLRVRCAVRPSSDVSALRNFVGDERWSAVDVVRVQLADRDECRRLVEDADIVYHLAAALRGSPAVLFAGTVVTTRRLIEATVEGGTVRRFVLVSSLGVYAAGQLPKGALLDEQCPVDPEPYRRDPYTYSKVVQEEVAWAAYRRSKLPLVVVRPGVIYGDERGCLSSRVGLQFGNWLLRMGGRQRLPYTYVENCAEAVLLAGLTPKLEGQVINVVDDELPTGAQVLRRLRQVGRRPPVIPIPLPAIGPLSRAFEWYHRVSQGQIPAVLTRYRCQAIWKPLRYSNAKAKSLLGWSPRVSFEEAVERSLMS